MHQLRIAPARKLERNLPLSIAPSVEQVKRTVTAAYQRTEIKDGMRALRDALDPADHELLILRLDRNMSWKDIARSLSELDDGSDVAQRAAALRKRFERVKSELRELAIQRGLLSEADET